MWFLLRKALQVIIIWCLPKWMAVLSSACLEKCQKKNKWKLISEILDWSWFIILETQLSYTGPDRATLAALNCHQVLRHLVSFFFVLREKEECVSQTPQEQAQTHDRITPQRILWTCSQLLRRNTIHQSACSRYSKTSLPARWKLNRD